MNTHMDPSNWEPADIPIEPGWAVGPSLTAGRWYSFGAEIDPHTGEQTNWCEPMDGPPEGGGFLEVTLESGEVLNYRAPADDLLAHDPTDCVCGPLDIPVVRGDGERSQIRIHRRLDGLENERPDALDDLLRRD